MVRISHVVRGSACVAPLPKRNGAQEASRRFICSPVETPNTRRRTLPNFLAFGDQRCSDATSEERVLPNAFGLGRFSIKRAPPKGGPAPLKTIIIAQGEPQFTKHPLPKISGSGALIVAEATGLKCRCD
jgi:hypothetical protein